jgi:hypothetical protein
LETYRALGWNTQVQRDAGDHKHCFPALAAFVTAHGREWLRTWRRLAGVSNTLYLCTDGLIVTDDGRINLERAGIIGDHGIGSCRIVESSDRVAIYASNHYEIGNKSCFSGIPIIAGRPTRGTITYRTKSSLSQRIAHPATESFSEIEQVAALTAKSDEFRLTESGWLRPMQITDTEESWSKNPINCQ